MSSIFSRLFEGTKAQGTSNAPVINNPNAQGQPAPRPGEKMQQMNPDGDPRNGVPPNGTSQPTNPPEPISPLDQFKDVWQPTKDAKGNVVPETNPLAQPLLSTDPAKFLEATRQMDFTKGIDPALATKALGGDPAALMALLNTSSQNAFIAASQLSSNVVENATQTNNSRFESVLEKKFKDYLVTQERTQDPILQHPSVQPMVDLAKRQLTRQHPDKSAGEIQQMAETMMGSFAEAFVGNKSQQVEQRNNNAPDPFDFSKFG